MAVKSAPPYLEIGGDIDRTVQCLARDRYGASLTRSVSLRLSVSARDALRRALAECTAELETTEKLRRKCRELRAILSTAAPTVAAACSQIGSPRGPNAAFVEGLPLPERVEDSKLIALALAAHTGSPFQYTSQNDGRVCAVLRPAPGAPINSNASAREFEPHVDDPNVPLAMRVETITLAGHVNTARTPTGYAAVADVLEHLHSSVIQALSRYEYEMAAPASFNQGESRWTAARPVLLRSSTGSTVIQYQSFGIRPTTDAARDALQALRAAIEHVMTWYVVEPGTALVFSNMRGVHARRAIEGSREVVRVYTRRSLQALQESDGNPGPVFDVKSVI